MNKIKISANFASIIVLIIFIFINTERSYSQDNLDLSPLVDKLNILERDIRDLQRKVNTGDISTNNENAETQNSHPKDIAEHEIRIIELEDQLRKTNGILEKLRYSIELLSKQTDQLKNEVNQKIISLNEITEQLRNKNTTPDSTTSSTQTESIEDNFEENNNNSTVQVLARVDPSDEAQIIKNDNLIEENEINNKPIVNQGQPEPQEVYQRAYNLLSKGEYAAAEIAFKSFIKNFPKHPLSSNSYYWLGETFYVRKNYQLAAYNFANGYKNFPKGSKAADQLLKLGISLYSLNKKSDACATLSKLNEEFKELPVRISNRAKIFSKKLEC